MTTSRSEGNGGARREPRAIPARYLTLIEAAAVAGLRDPSPLRRAIRQGRLTATKIHGPGDGSWVVTGAALLKWIATRRLFAGRGAATVEQAQDRLAALRPPARTTPT